MFNALAFIFQLILVKLKIDQYTLDIYFVYASNILIFALMGVLLTVNKIIAYDAKLRAEE